MDSYRHSSTALYLFLMLLLQRNQLILMVRSRFHRNFSLLKEHLLDFGTSGFALLKATLQFSILYF